MMTQDLKNFQDVIDLFEITPRTLRYYEYLELIAPVKEGRKRFYRPRELARLKLILNGRRFGFKLEEIRQWLELYDPDSGNETQLRTWIDASSQQIDELKSRRDELDAAILELTELRDNAKKALDAR